MKAIVIFANDKPELVVHPDSDITKIDSKLESLAKADYDKIGRIFAGKYSSYKQYRATVYWHTHEVEIEKL